MRLSDTAPKYSSSAFSNGSRTRASINVGVVGHVTREEQPGKPLDLDLPPGHLISVRLLVGGMGLIKQR